MDNQRAVYARLLPFATYIIFLALNDQVSALFLSLNIDVRFAYVLRVLSVLALLIYYAKDYIELKQKPHYSDFLYATISGCIVFVIWIFPYPTWLGGGDAVGFNPTSSNDSSTLLWSLVRISGSALIVPIMEELFWRSYIMRWFDTVDFLSLSPARISSFAYLGSAFLFASEHNLWLAGLFAGLVYGELYKTYQNLWVPIFAHAVTNGALGIWIVMSANWGYW